MITNIWHATLSHSRAVTHATIKLAHYRNSL